MKKTNKLLVSVLGLFSVAILSAISFQYVKPDFQSAQAEESPAHTSTSKDIYAETAIVAIAGREFRIPVAYIDSPVKNGRVEDSVVLEFVWPDFKSKKEFPRGEIRMKEIHAGNVSSFLLEDLSKKPKLQEIVELRKKHQQIVDFEEKVYGLDKYTAPKPPGKYAQKPDDTFLELSPQGKVLSYLRCSPPGKDIVPLCRHTFDHKGIRHSVLFSFSELPKWREKRRETIDFINRFEI